MESEQHTQSKKLFGVLSIIFWIGLVSLLTDLSSEMIVSILPLYLTSVLHTQVGTIGIIEGVAESTASILKLVSGWFSDNRKAKAFDDHGLKTHLDSYVQWAQKNNSLLVVTWDEDDKSQDNKIPTFMVGPMIKKGTYVENVNHYNLLRTIEDIYQLPHAGKSETVTPIPWVIRMYPSSR